MPRYRLYYLDGSTRDDTSEPYGVLCISEAHDDIGHKVITCYDYYILLDGHWLGVMYDGLLYYITKRLKDVDAVVVGVMVQNETFNKIYNQAKNDPDFKKRCGAFKNEKPRSFYDNGKVELL